MSAKEAATDPGAGRTARVAGVKVLSRETSKKMVQARLPFKRLNPVPKEDEEIPQGKKPNVDKMLPLKLAPCDLPLEDMENGCQMETVIFLPKPVNGRGPLDNYIKKTSKPRQVSPEILIDLTEDSNGIDTNSPNIPVQTLSPVTVPPDCGTLNNITPTKTERLPRKNSSLRLANSDDHKCDVLEIKEESPHSVDVLSETTVNVVPSIASPVRGDLDLSATEACASSSNTSSPVSTSSPEGHTASLLKDNDNFVSPTRTPKIPLNKQPSEKKKLNDKEQEEKRRKLQAEKEARDRVKEEVKRAKEEAKKKKDNEREQKAKEKREKKEKDDREKAEKLRLKEEKKKEKLEALEAKQEEKRKKEEEKRIKEEEKRTKAEKAEITRFLQKAKSSHTPKTFAQSCGKFAPFEIKKNMAVAPLCRVEFEQENSEQLDKLLKEQNFNVSFLTELKVRKPRKMGRTVMAKMPHLTSDNDEIQIVEGADTSLHEKDVLEKTNVPEQRKFGKIKLLQFCENYRPAYWGTWNRSSSVICPRNPWAQDTKLLDYEVDSDEEWEEEEPGESLSHSEGDEDDDDPKEDDDEDDDGFFVPHGYLSEDEGGVSEEECKNPENQKVRQKLKAKEWDELQSKGKKINVLKPLLIGCVWLGNSTTDFQYLQKYAVCLLDTAVNEEDVSQEINSNKNLEDKEILVQLLPLLHGNVNGSKTIIHEFQEFCRRGLLSEDASKLTVSESVSPNTKQQNQNNINIPSKARLKRIISENSVYEKRPDHRSCWYVHSDVLKSFQQEDLPVPCQWTYITQVNSNKDDNVIAGAPIQGTQTSSKRKSAGSMPITKFMKKANEKGAMSDTGAIEMDGFQADTEDDDDDDDCVILEVQSKNDEDTLNSSCKMEISFNEEMSSAPLQA